MNLRNVITSLDTSILLEGEPGLFMLEDVQEFLSQLFQMDNYELHPDFCFIDLQDKEDKKEKKKSIGVSEITPVLQKSRIKPVLFEKTVVVINNMDCLTIEAQNKLLLSLENSPYLFIIGISYSNRLLDTVLSRMRRISYKPSGLKEFLAFCSDTYTPEEAQLLYCACHGCIGQIAEFSSYLPLFKALSDACMGDSKKDIFSALHLVKEKDSLAVTKDRKLISPILEIMSQCFFERGKRAYNMGDREKARLYMEVVEKLCQELQQSSRSTYTKDDFFRTICYCVEH